MPATSTRRHQSIPGDRRVPVGPRARHCDYVDQEWNHSHRITYPPACGERPQSHATAINDAGAVVGVYFTSYEDVSVDGSFLYRHGRITLLKGMATATGINRYDTIVGDIYRPGIGPFAARWKAGHIKKLGTLGGHFSSAMAVGPTGTIIGESSKPGMSVHAFLWRAGEMRDMGTLGGYFSDAVAMNGKGWVVGQSR